MPKWIFIVVAHGGDLHGKLPPNQMKVDLAFTYPPFAAFHKRGQDESSKKLMGSALRPDLAHR